MRPKVLIALGVLAAFLGGAIFQGYLKPALANAFTNTTPAAETTQTTQTARAEPRRAVEREAPVRRRHQRSLEREVLIVAGSAGAGAAIGGAAKGAKGAGVGALAGGVGGLIYDLATRNR